MLARRTSFRSLSLIEILGVFIVWVCSSLIYIEAESSFGELASQLLPHEPSEARRGDVASPSRQMTEDIAAEADPLIYKSLRAFVSFERVSQT